MHDLLVNPEDFYWQLRYTIPTILRRFQVLIVLPCKRRYAASVILQYGDLPSQKLRPAHIHFRITYGWRAATGRESAIVDMFVRTASTQAHSLLTNSWADYISRISWTNS